MNDIDKKRWQEHKSASLLFEEANKLGFQPKWLTDYGLFEILVSGKEKYVFYSQTGLNSQLAAYLTKNKHICRTILQENGFLNIPYCLPTTHQEFKEFFEKYGKIILKPTMGERSIGVVLIESENQIKNLEFEDSILEKFISGREMRYLFLDGKVIAVQKRINKPTAENPWNKERHSVERKLWSKELVNTTLKVAKTFELKFGAVDFIIDPKNVGWILEVNCAPALWPFHQPVSGPSTNVAKMLLCAPGES